MKQYLISVYQPDTAPPPPEVLGPVMERVAAWRHELETAGAWVFTGGLQPPSTATVLRVRNGEAVITDGPFTEGKEHLGGFTVVRAEDLDQVLTWSRQFCDITGLPVEVRPLADVAS
ncbi:MAG TPA: YciI family protein [Streptosporangiaceae bacterium]|jgi:hypothetical protein